MVLNKNFMYRNLNKYYFYWYLWSYDSNYTRLNDWVPKDEEIMKFAAMYFFQKQKQGNQQNTS